MEWDNKLFDLNWSQEISNYDQKLAAAKKLSIMAKNGDCIGFGSGSTSFLAMKELAQRVQKGGLNITAIPTSNEIAMFCNQLGIKTTTLNEKKPDWCFDGADEVDKKNRLIKGRGGAMYREKLIMSNAKKAYILVDKTKFVDRLGQNFAVPIEVVPNAYISVKNRLLELGAKEVTLRLCGKSKDGPVITELGNYILDAKFDKIEDKLENQIKSIVGVLESGLFVGFNIEVIS
ncbi:ribose-5-phosphate isomerase [Holotrichia oblita]|nr:ribose-5-phosphate isomerase [Holotrichia oblita]